MKTQINEKKLTVISDYYQPFMDLNHIELLPQSVAELYTSVLIQSGDNNTIFYNEKMETNDKKEVKKNHWKSLGNNQKNILVIVNYKEAVHIPDNELALLTSILNACKLTVADVVIVNHNNHPDAGYKELAYILILGIFYCLGWSPLNLGYP
ncbi:MAG: hypothetical protein IPM85_03680 [Chitinophagaceae bacterium]|nr:hypothetical protein [Chitinophagaceae bacterium]